MRCTYKITSAVGDLTDTGFAIYNANKSCSGGRIAKCAEDISEIVFHIGSASKEIANAVGLCGGGAAPCYASISDALSWLGGASLKFAESVTDCT